jgi:lysozyme|tara:strand:+ start:452 stop:865 length:414 start_codon:yes stop_codon:yes gene_type:complete
MNNERLRETIIRHEGIRLDMYQDTLGIWTVGVGHNIQEKGISQAVMELMLEEDLAEAVSELKRSVSFFSKMPEQVQEALVNLAFNMGIPRLMQFKKTLAYLRDGNFEAAADELLDSRYAEQVGRRADEVADMIRTAE